MLGCKKDEALNYTISGTIVNGRTGAPVSGLEVKIQQKVISDGVYSALFTDAASAITDVNGSYSMTWKRENVAAFQMLLDKDQYISREISLSPTSLDANENFTYNAHIFAEAFITVHLSNTEETSAVDLCNFRFDDTDFDCNCCTEAWVNTFGADVDSTWTCRVYGDSWIRYVRDIATFEVDTILTDSIWCPAFQNTPLEVNF
jgi:hypothetical protein